MLLYSPMEDIPRAGRLRGFPQGPFETLRASEARSLSIVLRISKWVEKSRFLSIMSN